MMKASATVKPSEKPSQNSKIEEAQSFFKHFNSYGLAQVLKYL